MYVRGMATAERQYRALSAQPAHVVTRRAQRDRHNSARQKYSLVRGLVAVEQAIRSRQHREAG